MGYNPVASESPQNLLEMQISRLQPRSIKKRFSGHWDPGIWILARLSGDFSAPETLRNTDFNHRSEFLTFSAPLFPPLQNGDNTHKCALETCRHAVVTKCLHWEPGRQEGQEGTQM